MENAPLAGAACAPSCVSPYSMRALTFVAAISPSSHLRSGPHHSPAGLPTCVGCEVSILAPKPFGPVHRSTRLAPSGPVRRVRYGLTRRINRPRYVTCYRYTTPRLSLRGRESNPLLLFSREVTRSSVRRVQRTVRHRTHTVNSHGPTLLVGHDLQHLGLLDEQRLAATVRS